ncbi:MAG: NAD(P)-dependent oxidoreductase [Alphaproteobacteria bacterium]|nr:NAD(P)-dependent oxidoreductase [Alphaproteobacteria bacterium]MCB9699695.1 NAD(P)-dependent oxidoreductase [Alphaproteobacteria bacterium]
MTTTVAVLGTGLLGAGFAKNLLEKGVAVRVWNRTRAKAEALAALGAVVADSPADAVRGADRAHLVLSDDAAVDAVLEAMGDALPEVVIDHTTVLPAGVLRRVERYGRRYLHAPVFMGPKNAEQATGTMMVSGPADLVAAHAEALRSMTGKLVELGERPDVAAVYKLCGNGMLLSLLASTSDIIEVARGAGVDPVEMLTMFSWFDVAPVIGWRGTRMAKGQFGPPTFELAMARKDIRLMLETADSPHQMVLPAIAERMDELLAAGLGAEDYSVLGRRR